MIREKLIEKGIGKTNFRWRGKEVSRIEGLSGGVLVFVLLHLGRRRRRLADSTAVQVLDAA